MRAADQPSRVRRLRPVVACVLTGSAILTLLACGSTAPPATTPRPASVTCLNLFVVRSTPYPISCYVTFAAGVTYAQALRTVTDLGLQPLIDCPPRGETGNASWMGRWIPVCQRTAYAQSHALLASTSLVPPRLQST